jgi:hypothetical protein
MSLIEDTRAKTALKEIASHPFGKILHPGVTPMSLPNGAGKRIALFRLGNQMDMLCEAQTYVKSPSALF